MWIDGRIEYNPVGPSGPCTLVSVVVVFHRVAPHSSWLCLQFHAEFALSHADNLPNFPHNCQNLVSRPSKIHLLHMFSLCDRCDSSSIYGCLKGASLMVDEVPHLRQHFHSLPQPHFVHFGGATLLKCKANRPKTSNCAILLSDTLYINTRPTAIWFIS